MRPNIRERLEKIRMEIATACAQAGRKPSDVRLVAVSKTKSWEEIQGAWQAGQKDFGENYLQEALDKIAASQSTASSIRWHFIGQLQSNKCKLISGHFALVHSLDRDSVAQALDKSAAEKKISQKALLQINIDAEPSKGGIAADKTAAFLEKCKAYPHLDIRGLMCIPNPEKEPRAAFARLRNLLEEINRTGCYRSPLTELSMGMSADYREAILEGSTLVRIGTAIFGERPRK